MSADSSVERVVKAPHPDPLRAPAEVFSALWAIAHLGHLLRKTDLATPFPLVLAGLAVGVLARPSSTRRLAALALAQVLYLASKMPLIDNHLYLMGFANLGLLTAISARKVPFYLPRRYLSATFLLSYGAAAFSKLNAGFFDVGTSCAVKMFNDSVAFFKVEQASLGWIRPCLPFAVTGTELLIPLLLLAPPTRRAGVVIAVIFHLVISLSPTATALDFTLVVFALLFLFLPASAAERMRAWGQRALPIHPLWRMLAQGMLVTCIAVSVRTGWGGMPPRNPNWVWLASSAIGLGGMLIAIALSTRVAPRGLERQPQSFGICQGFYSVLFILQLLNISAPYLGSKNVGSFVMYSNLQTARGESNHFLIPRLPLEMGQDDLVEIVETSNEWLHMAEEQGDLVTWHELRRYLSNDPDANIIFRRKGVFYVHKHAREDPDLIERDVILHRLIGHQWVGSKQPRCRW